jgi:FkbM family methyltransferase
MQKEVLEVIGTLSNSKKLHALLTWPKFSFTSYRIVSSLTEQEVIPKTVIDVGANIGQFSIACSKLLNSPQIYAFEPLPSCHQQFLLNTARLPNIIAYPIALGDTQGAVDFYVNSHTHSSSILPLTNDHSKSFPFAKVSEKITVTVSTLDLVFSEVELLPPTLLKIDAQGYEANVLKGSQNILENIDFVLLEVSFKPLYVGEASFKEVFYLMEKYGFDFLRPVDFLKNPKSGEILQMDALFRRVNY